ncbi:MAG: O-antigen ligase family protein [Calditrichaeota bacterium]|nr:O-antigen ligase family protein [Calditrichota bacterium]
MVAYLIFVGFFDLYLSGTRYQLGWSKRGNFDTFLLLALLFLSSILLSSLSSSNLTMVLKALFKWVEIFFISFLIFWYVRDFGRFKIVYWLIFLSTIVSILFTFYQVFSSKLVLFQDRILPGYDSLYAFCLILPFWQRNEKFITRLLTIFLLLCAFLSLSRGVWLGIFLIFLAYQKIYNNKKLVLKLSAIFVIIGVVGLLLIEPLQQFVLKRVEEILTLKNVSNVERISLINYALLGFSSSPLWGIGALNFPSYLAKHGLTRGLVAKDLSVLAPHNLFLQILTEQGIFGFVIICLIFFFLYIILKKSWRVFADSCEMKPYLVGVQFLAISVLITVSLGFIANQFRLNFALFIGLTMSLLKLPKKRIWRKEGNEK